MLKIILAISFVFTIQFSLFAITGEIPKENEQISQTLDGGKIMDEPYHPQMLYPLDNCLESSMKSWEDGKGKNKAASFLYTLKTEATMRRMEKKIKYLLMGERETLEKALPNVDYICTNYERFLKLAKDARNVKPYEMEKKRFDAHLDRISGILKIEQIARVASVRISKIGPCEEEKVNRIVDRANERIGDFSTRDFDYFVLDNTEMDLHDELYSLNLRISELKETEEEFNDYILSIMAKNSKILEELGKEKSAELTELLAEIDELQREFKQIQEAYAARLAFIAVLTYYTPEELLDYISRTNIAIPDNCTDCDLLRSSEIGMTERATEIASIKDRIDRLPKKYEKIFKGRTFLLNLVMDIAMSMKNEYPKEIKRIEKNMAAVNESIRFIQGVLSVNRENLSAFFSVRWIGKTATGKVSYSK